MKFGYFVEVILKKVACGINVHVTFLCILEIGNFEGKFEGNFEGNFDFCANTILVHLRDLLIRFFC